MAGNPAGALGQLTDPIVNQIGRHLAATGGRFDGRELVTVLGGGNDLFVALETLQATLAAGGDPAHLPSRLRSRLSRRPAPSWRST